jgi:hypothetical protein
MLTDLIKWKIGSAFKASWPVDRKVENRADLRDLHLWAGIIFSGFVSQIWGGMDLESWAASTLQKPQFAIRYLRGRLPLLVLIFWFF